VNPISEIRRLRHEHTDRLLTLLAILLALEMFVFAALLTPHGIRASRTPKRRGRALAHASAALTAPILFSLARDRE
jgi:hypothetical protein